MMLSWPRIDHTKYKACQQLKLSHACILTCFLLVLLAVPPRAPEVAEDLAEPRVDVRVRLVPENFMHLMSLVTIEDKG